MGMRKQILLGVAEVHSGNAAEAEQIVDAVLKVLYEPTNDVVIAMCTNDGGSTHLGYDEERRALRTWQRGIKAVRAGK